MAEVAQLKDGHGAGRRPTRRRRPRSSISLLAAIPNLPAADVPEGADAEANVEIRRQGNPRNFSFAPKQHFEIGETLGLMDFDAASKLSGARFVVLKDTLARLERALAAFMLDIHTARVRLSRRYVPPFLVRDADRLSAPASCRSSPTTCSARSEGFWLIPTAEVPLTNLVADRSSTRSKLPLRFTAHTPCFRSEAGAAGKDTRGMIRLHQFSKVELVSIAHPDHSAAEHERMTACAEEVLKRLGIPYRVVTLCTGDMGFAAQKTYDIEVWLPGQEAYREISSCSNCGDFQARRMKARFRKPGEKGTRFVHTLNGSGLAVGRTMIAVLENYQEADGSVAAAGRAGALYGRREGDRARCLRRRSNLAEVAHPRHQRRRHQCARPQGSGAGGAKPVEGCLGGGAGDRAERRRSFPDAASAAAGAQARAAPLRRRRHADRLRAARRQPADPGTAARSCAVRRQPGRQSGRGRDLLRHHRRRHGGDAAGHSGDRALSQLRDGLTVHWQTRRRAFAPKVIRKLVSVAWPDGVLMNVNFPNVPSAKVNGIRVARQGRRPSGIEIVPIKDPVRPILSLDRRLHQRRVARKPDTDLAATRDGAISVTPLHLDLTHSATLQAPQAKVFA